MVATQVKVLLVDHRHMIDFYTKRNQGETAVNLMVEGFYQTAAEFAVEGTGEAAAEEVFDLTNNPNRQDEREQLYGRQRSVSVGDVVEVDGDLFLCASVGWVDLSTVN